MSRLQCRPEVDDDIFEIATYLLNSSEDSAKRFVEAAVTTLKDLASTPGVGSRKEFETAGLREVRSWPVRGFPKHLIYYLPLTNGIDVLGVVHGSRDVEAFLRRRV